ncbi:hypothetical protein KDN24_02240 [Bacillus sp. Bva_UNVM-123]|uniref:hypothetical protein n=1 Tax=Bacillus sp. Bva_UNVM-123 TaxID=2829798 RepID=UPI00391F1932
MGIIIRDIIVIIAIWLFGNEAQKEKQRESFKLAGVILLVFIGLPAAIIIGIILWLEFYA